MYEHRHEPLLPHGAYIRRVLSGVAIGLAIICGSLGIGVIGYHFTEGMSWLDALVSASMILFGEGPTGELQHDGAKWFASFYAMFSGIAFITIVGVMFAPVIHRLLHRFHLEFGDDAPRSRRRG